MKLKIGYSYWPVEYDNLMIDEEECGKCLHQQQIIKIRPEMSKAKEKEVLLHEVCHAIFTLAGLTDESSEEEVVNRITPLLLQFLLDNPDFLE